MDLNFYTDLTDGTGHHDGDPEFLDPQTFNGFDSDNKVTPFSQTVLGFYGRSVIQHAFERTTAKTDEWLSL